MTAPSTGRQLGTVRVRLTFALDVDLDAWAVDYGLDPADRKAVVADARWNVAVLVGDAVKQTADRMQTFAIAP